ncbi:RING finger and transmembrane domain-containing protein 1-like [Dorcoceras hygrometricum]|uniref:RING finger and transmembrane domain-containing protein 1-like n=1 Tax=Dorcoceras hygrometricum TaxID=472368 RepID=A0A2Z7CEK1_9LAMI|nr:RING finger and transmembrane domain-containing protein 1-like [Dorcoceras hygrometricum]
MRQPVAHRPATIARPVRQLTARSSAAKRGCARPARSNFVRPARPPSCVQRRRDRRGLRRWMRQPVAHRPATIARPVRQLTARSSAAKRGCARPARSNFVRPARPPSCVQRLVFSREAAPSVRAQCESEATIVRNRCAGHGQRSRAMHGQHAGSARTRARCEDDEAPPCAAAPWPMRCRFSF